MSHQPPSSIDATTAGAPTIAPSAENIPGIDANAVIQWFRVNARDFPWRSPGFSPWGSLVSEFMLQQTPTARVVPALESWLERWPTPTALAAESPGEAVRAWGRLGYPRRALWLHACAVTITEKYGGTVPSGVEELLSLPGVGPYTARAVAAFAFGVRTPVVDTNVRRVLARAVTAQGEAWPPNPRRDLEAMGAQLPEDPPVAAVFNAAVMELGSLVCIARAPRCEGCPLVDSCRWRQAGYPAHTGPRKTPQKRYEGSDREVRGLILQLVRAAVPDPSKQPPSNRRRSKPPVVHPAVTRADIAALWPDTTQLSRALQALITDGLLEAHEDGYRLPQ